MLKRWFQILILGLLFMLLGACNMPGDAAPSMGEGEDNIIPCDTSALMDSLENPPSDQVLEIALTPDCTYAFTLPYLANDPQGATGLPLITTDVILHGNHATFLKGGSELSPGIGFRYFHIDGGSLSIDSLNLVNGGWTDDILECDSLGTCGNGGAIYADNATLSISNSELSGNAALSGGAIFLTADSNLSLANTSFEGNFAETGGAIRSSGLITVLESSFRLNTVDLPGGGSRGGAFYNQGELSLIASTLDGNLGRNGGGAIYNTGTVTISTTSIIHNWSSGTSGIANHGVLSITNSTISSNQSGMSVGFGTSLPSAAISNSEGLIEIHSSTIVDNMGSGPGLSASRGGSVTITNSIIANNQGGSCWVLADIQTDGSANLDTDETCVSFTHHGNPFLGPLANNGGPTLTHALLYNSPAVDSALGDCPGADQRGVIRPDGDACDLGAYEYALLGMGGLPPFLPEMAEPEPDIQEFSAEALFPEGEPSKPSHTGRIEEAVPCYNGPGPMYAVVSSLQPGALVEIIGISENGDYIVILNPCYPGVPCWAEEGSIEIHDQLDPSRVIPDPALPEEEEEESPSPDGPACDPYSTQPNCLASGGTWQGAAANPPCLCP
jgi:predicted outer membrane repeat protein